MMCKPWLTQHVLILMFFIIIMSIVLSIHGATSSPSPNFMSYKCSGENYISGSSFEINLNDTLFTQLLPKARSTGFSNFSQGSGEDQVYALFYCTGDVDQQTCRDCVEAATTKIKEVCNFSKEGIVWFEECTLRYANQTNFSIDDQELFYLYYNRSGIVTQYLLDPFNETFDSRMKALVKEAAYSKGSLPGFATNEVNLSSFDIIRGLAQCTPDIVGLGCYNCLSTALRIRDTWANTIVFLPSCLFRYDLYETVAPVVVSPPSHSRQGSYFALVVVLPVVFFMLAAIGCAWLWINRHYLQGIFLTPRLTDTPVVEPITLVDVEHSLQGLRNYTFSQVRQMTKDFTVQVGKGGYGVVYRGILSNDTKEVAVKVLNQNNASEQFSNEVNVLTRISHRNIVSLLGYCRDEFNLALIYEFMDKGDLRSLLSGNPSSLRWTDRLKIAVDTAEGLDYLHYHSNDLVVHRDVKPANILLSGDLQAKLADFGSSKIFPKDVTTIVTQIVTSPGYTDPVYLQTGLLNMRADVYSFGIVLVELITGKSPSLEFNIVELFVKALSQGDLDKILDPKITRDLEDGSVWGAIELAQECVKKDATERPNMSEVVVTLKKCLDRRNVGNRDRPSTSNGIMNAMNSVSISMVPDPR